MLRGIIIIDTCISELKSNQYFIHSKHQITGMVAYFCHHLSDSYVDLSDVYVVLSDLYVDLSDHYVDLSENYHHN